MNRLATAGEMSATIAHELSQPLAAILINAETAEQVLQTPAPDLGVIREILGDIRRDDKRANEIVVQVRSFRRGPARSGSNSTSTRRSAMCLGSFPFRP